MHISVQRNRPVSRCMALTYKRPVNWEPVEMEEALKPVQAEDSLREMQEDD